MPERVDFYLLDSNDQRSRFLCACRVTAKAWQQKLNVYIQVESEPDAEVLDHMLWEFQPTSFVPHAQSRSDIAARSAVLIGVEPALPGWQQLLVSLTRNLPANVEQYQRIADFIVDEETEKQAGRARYRAYSRMGIQPQTHQIQIQ